MKKFPILLALLASTAVASPALAQYVRPTYPTGAPQSYPQPSYPQQVQTLTDADRLAEQIRRLAVDPKDLDALVEAGRLAERLDDSKAAAAFYARAEKVSPNDPRVIAGTAAVLVHNEHPGEALRRFAEAERMGGDISMFAADRALAYDLVGDQGRAQALYRQVLSRMPDDDETIRRYALSLAIGGAYKRAEAVLDPLLRKSDRGAWRGRAFILAMSGNVDEAERIATNMMPPGLAQGLAPFFQRLPSLPAVDRAFAVNFGEVRPTPARIADLQLAPRQSPAPAEVDPVQVAVAAAQAPAASSRRGRRKPQPSAVPVQIAQAVPLVPPSYRPMSDSAPAATTPMQPQPSAVPTQLAVNRVTLPAVTRPAVVAKAPANSAGDDGDEMRVPANPDAPQPTPTPPPVQRPSAVPQTAATQPAFQTVQPAATGIIGPSPTGSTAGTLPVASPPPAVVTPAPVMPAPVTVAPILAAPVETAEATPPPPPKRGSEDAILSAIIANITVPASELGVGPAKPVPAEPQQVAMVPPTRVIAPPLLPEEKPTPKPVAETKGKKSAAAEPDEADPKAKKPPMIALTDPKTKKTVQVPLQIDPKTKKPYVINPRTKERFEVDPKTKKVIPPKPDPAKLEPARIWVQVAGGATERDLPKEWKRAVAKAPAAFKGKTGWTTPLRVTNRVLAGPFKDDDAAQDFVNALKKEGISAFEFTSDAGQKITKLPAGK